MTGATSSEDTGTYHADRAGAPAAPEAQRRRDPGLPPWLQEEIRLVKPRVIVALGATAAQALLGKECRVTRDRGKSIAAYLEGPPRTYAL